jgi:type I restriction enzyme M protein
MTELMLHKNDGVDPADIPGSEDAALLGDGLILDYITGEFVKDSPKEQVRQRIARALLHEYGISVDDMVPDFPLKIDGRRKRVDIAIFDPGTEKVAENLRRIVVCDKEPKMGTKGAYKLRSHEQAQKEFGFLHTVMAEVERCRYGLWTNGLEFFFFEKEETRFDTKFRPIGDWPMGDESLGSRTVASHARLRKADREMLRTAFRRCHNFIHGNEGMPKDAAFWQFLYLIFAKMHDEQRGRDQPPRFWTGMFEKEENGRRVLIDEQFDEQGRQEIRQRIEPLFEEVRDLYKGPMFRGNEEITLSDRALAFMVSELAKYDFHRTDLDAKGAAYQELVKHNIRGDRGQYFTPRNAIQLAVQMLDPQPHERVFDPACGTGGFLVATANHWLERFKADTASGGEETGDFLSVADRLRHVVERQVFGADFDPFLVRATTMNLMMAAGARANVFHMDSLSFPRGHLPGVEPAEKAVAFGTVDVLLTNPPFGSEIPITDPNILVDYDLAAKWDRVGQEFRRGDGYQSAVAPEVLFIQRAVRWLRPGGRMAIVLPNGILGNPSDEYIRAWILRHCWVLASVELPVEVFIHEADVNILTSLLFLKKKSEEEMYAESLRRKIVDYPVFMAVAEKVGYDRRGNTIYKRAPDGQELLEEVEDRERIRIGGRSVVRIFRRKQKMIDDDLPRIAEKYREFRVNNPEPGV